MAVEEGRETRRGAKVQGPMAARLRFKTPATPAILRHECVNDLALAPLNVPSDGMGSRI